MTPFLAAWMKFIDSCTKEADSNPHTRTYNRIEMIQETVRERLKQGSPDRERLVNLVADDPQGVIDEMAVMGLKVFG